MAAENTLHAFFDQADALHRILFLYGGTDDAYFTKGALQSSMEYMLEEHLTQCGYDVVMFYNGVQGLYCFTRANAEKRDRYFGSEDSGSDEVEDALADLFGTQGEPQGDGGDKPAPLRVEINDLEIASFADKVMRSTQVRSALVFSDGWDFLDNTAAEAQRTLANRLRSWYHIGSQNQNICILCFSKLNRTHLEACIKRSPCWGFLEEKIFNGNCFSDAVKYISIPDKDEIYELLRFQPAFRRLKQESERNLVLTAAQQQLHTMGNSLKGLAYFLDNTPDPIQSLLDGLEDDSRVMDTLRSTQGWEPVAWAIERMSEVVAHSERKAPPKPHPGTIMRMNEGNRGFVPAGVTLNMVLEGPPGTGKTTVAKLLGRIYRRMGLLPSGHVVECARDDLVGQFIGDTAVKTRDKIEEAMGGILFVDEAYTLYRGNQTGKGDFGQEALDTLVEAMTRNVGSFAVVLAGYPDEMETLLSANPGLRSRFGQNIVHIPDYQPPLLQKIALEYLSSQYASTGLSFDPALLRPGTTGNKPLDVFFQGWFDARDRKSFGNARDVRNLVDGLVPQALYRNGTTIRKEDFPPHLQDYFKESDLDLDSVLASLSDIVGLQDVKDKLTSIVRRLRMYNLQKAVRPDIMMNKIAPGHYLFCVNPGTGKSTISVKFAQILGALRIAGRFEPVRVTGTMLYETWEKKGVEGVREVIQGALGGVLFIDEAHQLIQTPLILQLLLDPMIENRSELCVILACYSDQVEDIFQAEPGLRSRLSGIFHFEDYTAEELTEIFVRKITKAGYTLGADGCQAVGAWMKHRLAWDAVSHNGRYAESLFALAQDRMAERLADRINEGTIQEEELFEILPEDLAEESAVQETASLV